MSPSERYYKHLNAEMGAEFDLFVAEHPDWLVKNIPNRARVVFQIEDAGFNAWAQSLAEKHRRFDKPARPVVLVHIRKMRPRRSRIVQAEVERITPRRKVS